MIKTRIPLKSRVLVTGALPNLWNLFKGKKGIVTEYPPSNHKWLKGKVLVDFSENRAGIFPATNLFHIYIDANKLSIIEN